MKVFMQYPWFFPDSPYYKYLFDYKPDGVEYINPLVRSRDVITTSDKLLKSNNLKHTLRNIIFKTRLPIPNVRYSKADSGVDLIHCAHCLSLNNKPWVADIEIFWQGILCNVDNPIGVSLAKHIMLRNSCKRIIAWTDHVKEKMVAFYGKELESKIDVVYPAVEINKKNDVSGKRCILLFVARDAEAKGIKIALDAYVKLVDKYKSSRFIVVGNVNLTTKERYSSVKNIEFHDLMPRETLKKKIFPKASIFVYPGISDTFGFGYLEAMSFGIPILTVDNFGRKCIVEPWKNGLVSKVEFDKNGFISKIDEDDFLDKLDVLMSTPKLRKRLGDNNWREVKSGRYSLGVRNAAMKKIYEDALR